MMEEVIGWVAMRQPEPRESTAYMAAGFTTAACVALLVTAASAVGVFMTPRLSNGWELPAAAEFLATLLFMIMPSAVLATAIVWGVPAVLASGLSYPITRRAIAFIRGHDFVRPWLDIAYGIALGLVWSGALALLPRALNWTVALMGIGALTGLLWGFWFWWFDRREQRAHPGNN